MAYLIENDVRILLTKRDLDIVMEISASEDGEDFLLQRQSFAIDFVKSKLQHRFDPDQIFIDVNIFDIAATYAVNDLIYYEENAWVLGTTYVINDRISYQNDIFQNILSTSTELPTNATNWTKIVRNKQYFKNILVGSGVLPEITTSWTLGDTRHQLIYTYTVTIAAYELFKKVQPNMIPDWLISSRDEAVTHLDRISRGLDTVILPLYFDSNGDPDDAIGQEIDYAFKYLTQDYDF